MTANPLGLKLPEKVYVPGEGTTPEYFSDWLKSSARQ
jgi:hypothetical protein